MLTALWMMWDPAPVLRLAISLATFVVFVALSVHFVRRVAYNIRNMQAKVHLNPFI